MDLLYIFLKFRTRITASAISAMENWIESFLIIHIIYEVFFQWITAYLFFI